MHRWMRFLKNPTQNSLAEGGGEAGELSPCSQSKHGCFTPRKKVFSLDVLIGILVDITKILKLYEIESSQNPLFFSIIKHAGFSKLPGLEY